MSKHTKKQGKTTVAELKTLIAALATAQGDSRIISSIEPLLLDMRRIMSELKDCTYFVFLDPEFIDRMSTDGHDLADSMFWTTFNMMLIYSIKTEAAAVSKLIEALKWSIAMENEIGLALCGRAMIEHASATYSLQSALEPLSARLAQNIWPAVARSEDPKPNEEERNIFGHLMRFALGRRVQLNEPTPLSSASKAAWARYNDSLQLVPDQLKTKNILTELDKLGKNIPLLRSVYEFLSEYCHPNSSSRTFEYMQRMAPGSYVSEQVGASAGLVSIGNLLSSVAPSVCGKISESFVLLDRIRLPMHRYDVPKSSRDAFPGAMSVVDNFGRLSWIRPEDVRIPDVAGVKLSKELETRAAAVFALLKEHLGSTNEGKWVEEFGKEGNPESEIAIWERMARVFAAELRLRGEISREERGALYEAVLRSTSARTLPSLLAISPTLSLLPNLERVHREMTRRD